MKLGHSVEQLVGEKINDYVQIHHLGQKVLTCAVHCAGVVVVDVIICCRQFVLRGAIVNWR
jgi:hypothetical protein